MDEKISVIVITYNYAKYIEKCIDSILNQTYKNIEIYIIDDGSTDDTKSVLKKYEKCAKIYYKKHEGVSATRNFGISLCKTKYFMFVDADDFLEPISISILYKRLIETNSDIAMGSIDNNINKKGHVRKEHILTNDNKYDYLLINKIIYFMAPPNKIYKTEIFKDLRFPDIVTGEDEYLITYILQKINKMVIVPEKTYNYVIHSGSLSSKVLENYKQIIWVFKDRRDFFIGTKYYEKAQMQYMNYCIYLYNEFRKQKIIKKDIVLEIKSNLHKYKKIKYFVFSYATDLYYFLYRIRGKIWKKYQ